MILDPIIRGGYLVWLYAEPKIGKTWLALAITYAVSVKNGVVGKWRSPEPFAALYVDGEMLPDELKELIAMVMVGAGDLSGRRPFSVMCAKGLPAGVLNLESEETQRVIETGIVGKSFLVLDNFQASQTTAPGALNKILPWLRRITRNGVAVLVLDHTNRDGDLQRSIRKERLANLVISLNYPAGAAKAEERIQVEFPQARRLHGADAEPFELRKVFTRKSFALELVNASLAEPLVASGLDTNATGRARKRQERVMSMAKVAFHRNHQKLSFPTIEKKHEIARATASDLLKAAAGLKGQEKAVFDAELERLVAEQERA